MSVVIGVLVDVQHALDVFKRHIDIHLGMQLALSVHEKLALWTARNEDRHTQYAQSTICVQRSSNSMSANLEVCKAVIREGGPKSQSYLGSHIVRVQSCVALLIFRRFVTALVRITMTRRVRSLTRKASTHHIRESP